MLAAPAAPLSWADPAAVAGVTVGVEAGVAAMEGEAVEVAAAVSTVVEATAVEGVTGVDTVAVEEGHVITAGRWGTWPETATRVAVEAGTVDPVAEEVEVDASTAGSRATLLGSVLTGTIAEMQRNRCTDGVIRVSYAR